MEVCFGSSSSTSLCQSRQPSICCLWKNYNTWQIDTVKTNRIFFITLSIFYKNSDPPPSPRLKISFSIFKEYFYFSILFNSFSILAVIFHIWLYIYYSHSLRILMEVCWRLTEVCCGILTKNIHMHLFVA